MSKSIWLSVLLSSGNKAEDVEINIPVRKNETLVCGGALFQEVGYHSVSAE
jgi:hypothetical protein